MGEQATKRRPRSSQVNWIGLMTPSFSDAKRLASKPGAILNVESSASGLSCSDSFGSSATGTVTVPACPPLARLWIRRSIAAMTACGVRRFAKRGLVAGGGCEKLRGAIPVHEVPVRRPPAVEPESVFLLDGSAQRCRGVVLRLWKLQRFPDFLASHSEARRSEVHAILGETGAGRVGLDQRRVQVHESRAALASDLAHRFRIGFHIVIALSEVRRVRGKRPLERHR